MAIEPHAAFRYTRPDEVAECWGGVLAAGDLYECLWACVTHFTAPSPEESEEPCVGVDCVADFWDLFTPEQQEKLNELAADRDRYMDRLMARSAH